MTTANLAPLSAFDDAMAKARYAAVQTLSLVSVTLHRQFPTGAYLVLKRPMGDYDDDTIELDSVRDVQGEIVRELNPYDLASDRLPDVPEDLAALWGDTDPRKPEEVLELLRRIDELARYDFLDFLPEELRTDEEIEAENEGGRTPLGIPLAAEHCQEHGPMCEPDDHAEPPTVHGK
ncbi:hypothetical protein IM697_18535 [Streptomyces ferrugineus]|uniref:Uncharacterized protein n=1 Tax=Streptomyces ferrugineus TaxID=1413221 RepID=A0A7M2SV45_9ACTN|nr:hypothetical protein [Streptomyces ferrugineus]QOV40220.1 hypothetical protein IM697_18535 [Streptomyces ferrugineus]